MAAKVIIAVPVAGRTFDKFLHEADEILVLEQPENYQNVGQAYDSFEQLNDKEVVSLLNKYQKFSVGMHAH
jgi:predicted phosphoribosyltransferase